MAGGGRLNVGSAYSILVLVAVVCCCGVFGDVQSSGTTENGASAVTSTAAVSASHEDPESSGRKEEVMQFQSSSSMASSANSTLLTLQPQQPVQNSGGGTSAAGNSSVLSPWDPMYADDEPEDESIFDLLSVRITLGVLYTIVFCFCVFGNLSVILVVTLHWKMRSIAKFCMGNLACANLCVGIFCVFQNLSTYLSQGWIFGNFMCKMYYFIPMWAQAASVLILVLTCVERYLVILHPFKCRQFLTMRKLRYIVIGIWIISACISAPRLHYFNTVKVPSFGKDHTMSTLVLCIAQNSKFNRHGADMTYFIVLFVLPLTIMGILYTRLGLFLSRADSILRATTGNSSCRREALGETLSVRHGVGVGGIPLPLSTAPAVVSPPTTIITTNVRQQRKTSRSESSSGSACGSSSTEASLSAADEKNSKKKKRTRKERKELKKLYESARYGDGPDEFCSGLQQQTQHQGQQQNGNDDCSEETEVGEVHIRLVTGYNNNNRSTSGALGAVVATGEEDGGDQQLCNRVRRATPVISRKRASGSRRAVVRMLIVIVLTFAVCNLPFHVRKLCQNYLTNYKADSDFGGMFAVSTFLLMFANCAVNPILYAFMSRGFRQSFVEVMCDCQWRKRFSRGANYSV